MRIGIFSFIRQSTPYFLIPLLVACGPESGSSRLSTNQFPEKDSKVLRQEKVDGWQKIADVPESDARFGIQCVNESSCWLFDTKRL
jgi:hypothetical protein